MKKELILIIGEQFEYDSYSTYKHDSYIELYRDYHTAIKRCEELNRYSKKIENLYDNFYNFIFKERRTNLDETLNQYLQENNINNFHGYKFDEILMSDDEIVRLLNGENVIKYLINSPQLSYSCKLEIENILGYFHFFSEKRCKVEFADFISYKDYSGYNLPKFKCIKLNMDVI